jgi:hypothetical protein
MLGLAQKFDGFRAAKNDVVPAGFNKMKSASLDVLKQVVE